MSFTAFDCLWALLLATASSFIYSFNHIFSFSIPTRFQGQSGVSQYAFTGRQVTRTGTLKKKPHSHTVANSSSVTVTGGLFNPDSLQ